MKEQFHALRKRAIIMRIKNVINALPYMRKYLKIAFFILTMLFICRSFFLPKHYDEFYIFMAYIILAVPYVIYESVQKAKDEHSKSLIFNRWVMVAIVMSVILILMFILMEIIYPLPS
ncbi:MAG: hypothetical protein CFE23_09110 [Flavobacterium sp. BFFFF1]|nr:MAG: hypothetical protein CFE23_09110 [Flavobacterium sp. BFFFF1]